MTTIFRLFILVPFAWVLSIPAAFLFLTIAGFLEPTTRDIAFRFLEATGFALGDAVIYEEVPGYALGWLAAGLWWASLAVLIVPVVVVGLAGELMRVGSYIWYAGGTGLITALVPWIARAGLSGSASMGAGEGRIAGLLFLTGAVAGTIYWLVAGRSAGAEQPVTS